ncbi:MAG: hypothetical protein K2X87_07745 [Gemmataceae bacterium]|nr:hypothetical protein [Gemmataceae bacterium]
MTDDPFLLYLVEALNLVHPRFAGVDGSGPPDRAAFVREFYHQLRRLWDKALPVQLGLGHVLIRSDPDGRADLVFWRLGERGEPDHRLGAVAVLTPDDLPPSGRETVIVFVGPEPPDVPPGIPVVHYDAGRRAAVVLNPG